MNRKFIQVSGIPNQVQPSIRTLENHRMIVKTAVVSTESLYLKTAVAHAESSQGPGDNAIPIRSPDP